MAEAAQRVAPVRQLGVRGGGRGWWIAPSSLDAPLKFQTGPATGHRGLAAN